MTSTTPVDGAVRVCTACGTSAAAEQDWCLECGARLESSGGRWQQPAAIMASVLLIFVAAIALALSEVAKDAAPPPPASTIPPTPDTPTPADTTTPPKTSKNPTDTSTPSSTDSGSSPSGVTTPTGGGGYVPPPTPTNTNTNTDTTPTAPPADVWPETKKAYTVILLSTTSKDEASALARKAKDKGVKPVGILSSDTYKNLSSGLWLVWAGQFPTEDAAYAAADGYAAKGFQGESVEYIRKKGTDDSGSGTTSTDTTTNTTSTGD